MEKGCEGGGREGERTASCCYSSAEPESESEPPAEARQRSWARRYSWRRAPKRASALLDRQPGGWEPGGVRGGGEGMGVRVEDEHMQRCIAAPARTRAAPTGRRRAAHLSAAGPGGRRPDRVPAPLFLPHRRTDQTSGPPGRPRPHGRPTHSSRLLRCLL